MKGTTIHNFKELFDIFENTKIGQTIVYRGMTDNSYELKTSLGRCEPEYNKTIRQLEKRMMKLFKESSISYLENKPQNELEWLAIAQHFGLPTRLLDWSYNPLVATFFAVEENENVDGVIYTFSGAETIQDSSKIKPTDLDKVIRYRPPHISTRIQNQAGLFTVHNEPEKEFVHDKLSKIIIPSKAKRNIKNSLFKYGISQKLIYPGLEGISKDLKWLETKVY